MTAGDPTDHGDPTGAGGPPGPDDLDPAPQIDAGAQALAGSVALLFAVLMHLMVGGFVAVTGRIAPGWVVAVLVVAWVGVGVLIWRWHRRRPLATLLLPFVAAAMLWGTLSLGQRALDWGA